MSKKIILGVMLFIMATGVFGCLSTDHRHNRRHMWAIENDIEQLHRTTDRHFFNYDWDDPYRN